MPGAPEAPPGSETEATATPVAEATATPVAEATETPVAEATPTPVPEVTETAEAEATATPVAEATATPVAEATATPVPSATPPPVAEAAETDEAEAAATPVAEATATPETEATPTPSPSATPTVETTASETTEPDEETTPTLGSLRSESSSGSRAGVASTLADAPFDARLRAANAAAIDAYDAEATRASAGAADLAAARVRHEYPRAEAEAALGRKASPGAKKSGSRKAETETSSRASKKVSGSKTSKRAEKEEDDFERFVLGETQKESLLALSRAHAMCTKPLGNAFLGQTGLDEVIKRRLFEIHYKHEEQLAAGADAAAAIGMRRAPARPGELQGAVATEPVVAKPRSVWANAEIIDSYREVQRQMEEVKAAADRARVAAATPKIPERVERDSPMEFDGVDYDEDVRGDITWNPAGSRRWEREHGDYVGVAPRRPETLAERDARKSAQMFDYESPILDN